MTPLVSFAAFYCTESECVCGSVCACCVYALVKSRCYKGLVSLESESGTSFVCVYVCVCEGKKSVSHLLVEDLRPVN